MRETILFRASDSLAEDISPIEQRPGNTVIADLINPPQIARSAWRNVAERIGMHSAEFRVIRVGSRLIDELV
jgi:hypothetical protein